jgi:hypothetical protein
MLADAPFIGFIPVRDRVAWFTDPDGNILSFTAFAAA